MEATENVQATDNGIENAETSEEVKVQKSGPYIAKSSFFFKLASAFKTSIMWEYSFLHAKNKYDFKFKSFC